MVFNSIDFVFFFPIVYFLYIIGTKRYQNILLLFSSYFFYGYWDYRYLSLLFISTVVDYFSSLGIVRSTSPGRKKFFLILSLASNLGILGFFKYFNFFSKSTTELLNHFGFQADSFTVNFLLPLGISFYTFQTMSYTIDVYKGKLEPTSNFWDFALYVSFFPQLVAGPIERATHLLPQISKQRILNLEETSRGVFLILLGYYKKVYIADNLALIVDPIFNDPSSSGSQVLFANFVFFFQIYGDFSGYSDIARGLSKMLGFDLMMNFNLPAFSLNVGDFWRRWHISFMSWLRDYVYFSLGSKDSSELRKNINNLIVFFLSGLWHGANWTFVIWGTICGFINLGHKYLSPYLPSSPKNRVARVFYLMGAFFLTINFISFPLIYFRSPSVEIAWMHNKAILLNFGSLDPKLITKFVKNIFFLMAVEVYMYSTDDEFAIFRLPVYLRVAFYLIFFYSILILGNFANDAFIYFVF